MNTWLKNLPRERRITLGIAASAAVLGAAAVPIVPLLHGAGAPATAPPRSAHSPAQVSPTPTPVGQTHLTWGERRSLHGAIARLRTISTLPPVTSTVHPAVSGPALRQPDLYAEAFTTQLLTQDYRTSRQALLAWVQAESAGSAEPTVVGLTPPALRSRLAVASVQDQPGGGAAPVPSAAVWATRADAHGYSTVRIERVSTPIGWATAVADGRITDPGVTAREVDATVTLHTLVHGQPETLVTSVALTMNLEGPPVRAVYGFVTAVIYTVVGVR